MGDIFGVNDTLVQILVQFASNEVSLIAGLKDDVNAIATELQSISVFLKHAEEKAEGNDIVKNWVTEVRMLAYDIEDVIDRYQLFQKENKYSKTKQYLSLEVRSMGTTIRGLRERAINITRKRVSYRFNDQEGSSHGHFSPQVQLTTSYFHCTANVDAANTVGDDVAKGEIIQLLKLRNLNSPPSTIAVVGMRGLGKTTVITSVYHDETVKSCFPLRAWIPVSQPKRHSDVLRSMIVQFLEGSLVPDITSMDKKSLVKLLQNYLKERRYMVVVDDVQEEDTKLATYVKKILPFNKKGSKILMTTRQTSMARAWLDGSITGMYKLKPLPSEKAWELFCKKTFQSSNGHCPSTLNDKARGILRQCGGLPPVIISISRLLSANENDMDEWEKVNHSLGFYLATSRQLSGISQTFMQNYYDLPFHLKPCFLYFGLFPKGQSIGRMRLLRLWIAEGFIRESRGQLTLEEIAQEYLSELINMGMIEVKSKDVSGKVKSMGLVSEFLHEMIMSKFEELSFCKILSKKDCVGNETSRRLSIHNNHSSDALEFLDNVTKVRSSIRSLFIFDVAQEIMLKVCNKAFFTSISLLKVLDLFNAPIDVIPKEVGKLLNLRYLSLRCTRVSELPSTVGKLENLHTLDLKQTFIYQLPNEISHLSRLRHLLGYYYEYDFRFSGHCLKKNGISIPEGSIGKCLELQQLNFWDLSVAHRNWAVELGCLTQLRKLGIVGLNLNEGDALCSVIDGMKCLQVLNVFSKSKSERIDLSNVKSPPQKLKRLYLNGPLISFPGWVHNLHGLVKIRLRWSNLANDPLETLQLLPNLLELKLVEAFTREDLYIAGSGFQKLKTLHLLDLYSLKSLTIDKGALPVIREMSIGESKNLQLPSGIKYLFTLKTLSFYNMPSRFSNLIRPGETYHSIIKHVPNVLLHMKQPKGYWQTYNLR